MSNETSQTNSPVHSWPRLTEFVDHNLYFDCVELTHAFYLYSQLLGVGGKNLHAFRAHEYTLVPCLN